jgi:hypothetical protein
MLFRELNAADFEYYIALISAICDKKYRALKYYRRSTVNQRIETNIRTCIMLNFKVTAITTQQTPKTGVPLDMVTVPHA